MKKLVAMLGIVVMLGAMTIQCGQVAKDGSFQVTFRNGYNISYDTQTRTWMNFK